MSAVTSSPGDKSLGVFRFIFRKADYIFPIFFALSLLIYQPRFAVDTSVIASLATWGDSSADLIHVGYLLSYPLLWLRTLFPAVEWYTVVLYLIGFFTVVTWSRLLVKSPTGTIGWKNLFSFALLLLFMVNFISSLYYHLAATACMASSLLLMLHAIKGRKWLTFSMASTLMVAGASVRWDASPSAVPLFACLGLCFILNKKWKECATTILAAALVSAVYHIQPLFSNTHMWEPGLHASTQNLTHINTIRSSFCDYADPAHADKQQAYRDMGMSDNDIALLYDFAVYDERRSDSQWWEQLKVIRTQNNERLSLNPQILLKRIFAPAENTYLVWTPFHLLRDIPLMALSLLAFTWIPFSIRCNDARYWLAAAMVADVLLMFAIGRVTIGGLWAVYLLGSPMILFFSPDTPLRSHRQMLWMSSAVFLAVCSAFFVCVRRSFSPFQIHYMEQKQHHAIMQECRQHPENVYFCNFKTWTHAVLPTSSLLSKPYKEPANIMLQWGWAFLSPAAHQELQKRGIGSDREFMLKENHRLITTNGTRSIRNMQIYHLEHHGVHITPILEKMLDGGLQVYRFQYEYPQEGNKSAATLN